MKIGSGFSRLAAGALAAVSVLAGAASHSAAEKLKVGFVYAGPIGDHGWTYRHEQGRLAVEKALGDRVETTYVENVSDDADAERVIRQLALSGHRLIFATSFGLMNATVKVARRFPNVMFEHATGHQRAKNLSTYAARSYEGRAVAGVVAGKMTKSNVIGYIGSFPIPEVVRGINAFTLALRAVNPRATVAVAWANTWYDPGREADAAKALIDRGADIILQHTGSPAPIQIAQSRGKWAVGHGSDMRKFGPDAELTAIVDVWDGYYIARTKAMLDGAWASQDIWGGFKAGMVRMAPYNEAIPPEIVALAKQAEADIASGKRHPFQGPIRNQKGEIVVPEGKTLSDDELLSMDWFVEGVEGELPK